jgi:hypothetical protein
MRFIQWYAVDRVVELAEGLGQINPEQADPFNRERRIESRAPKLAYLLPDFAPGYHRNKAAARKILAYLDEHFEINKVMKAEILRLAA